MRTTAIHISRRTLAVIAATAVATPLAAGLLFTSSSDALVSATPPSSVLRAPVAVVPSIAPVSSTTSIPTPTPVVTPARQANVDMDKLQAKVNEAVQAQLFGTREEARNVVAEAATDEFIAAYDKEPDFSRLTFSQNTPEMWTTDTPVIMGDVAEFGFTLHWVSNAPSHFTVQADLTSGKITGSTEG